MSTVFPAIIDGKEHLKGRKSGKFQGWIEKIGPRGYGTLMAFLKPISTSSGCMNFLAFSAKYLTSPADFLHSPTASGSGFPI